MMAPPRLRLTPHQSDLYLAHQAAVDATTYHSGFAYRLTGVIDETVLRERLEILARQHPVLASRIAEDESGLYFAADGAPPRFDACEVAAPADGAIARHRLRRECLRPLDPTTGPLVRVVLLRYSDNQADLVVVAHHLVIDERSGELIARGLLGGESWPPNADRSMSAEIPADRVAAAAARLRDADLAPQLAWARDTVLGTSTVGDTTEVHLDTEEWNKVQLAAAQLRITPYSVMLAAAGLIFGRFNGSARPVVGASVSRRTPRTANTIGYFNATVLVPLNLDATVREYLVDTHRRCLEAYRSGDVPLSQILPPRTRNVPQLVVVPTAPLPDFHDDAVHAEPHPDIGLGTAQFPLALYLHPKADGGMRCLLRYQTAQVDQPAAERFCSHLRSGLSTLLHDFDTGLADVPSLTPDDAALLARISDGGDLTASQTTIHDMIGEQAARRPEAVAVSGPSGTVTYRRLWKWSGDLARVLHEAGVRPGDRVGVRLGRDISLIAALLAVMRAGAAYVPLDPVYPEDRLRFLAEDTGIDVILTEANVDRRPVEPERELPSVNPEAIAYVIHTSGTSGRPKGVQVRHRNVVALIDATAPEFGLGPDDVWAMFHSFAFDFSVWEIWACLATGGRLVVVDTATTRDPERFAELLHRERVTVVNQTPSAFSQLVATSTADSIRLLIFGGEPLDPSALLPWFDRHPESRCRAVNMYGITETTVHCTWHTLERGECLRGTRSVGTPLPGWRIHVLDPLGREVPPGTPGEIHVGGAGVTAGYLNRPELTAERFHTHPRLGKLYRSGDVGRWNRDGRLEHLGRLDDQVKIRGHRIELGEIRNSLLEQPSVAAAAALVRQPGGPESARIDAYLVARPGADADLTQLRQSLAKRLPAYMVPATITVVPELPLTPNGKLDSARLPAPAIGATIAGTSAPAAERADDRTSRVVTIWQDVLGVPVGLDDNFFELGGNSLLAVRLNAALRGNGFPGAQLRDIFRHATPRRLAAAIESRVDVQESR